ncbi:DUF1918 domain-containing protein [Pseudactinotalea sp. Z1739]|uniref:DUF1918 domain-containing protein n=1 Tax=Pseudactinotalea sp. Z1739 TaxID=3413028 RepID=UPI003C7B0630
MRANIGDRVVIESAQVGQPPRDGEVLEVRGPDGAPPWVVRWSGEEAGNLYFPGPDTRVSPAGKD